MKTATRLRLAAIVGTHLFTGMPASAAGLTVPSSDAPIADAISSGVPIPYTAAELAVPPSGEIQKSYLREIIRLGNAMNAILAPIAAGPSGQGSPWYAVAQSFKSGLHALAASRLCSDCMALIPPTVTLLESKQSAVPPFAIECSGIAGDCGPVIMHAIERCVNDPNASISPSRLIEIVKVFSTPGFIAESDWEDRPIPVYSADIMILDSAAVVAHLKTRPWQEADHFLGKATAAEAFARYAASGAGLAVLQTKFAAHQPAITAKWNELEAWVGTQRPRQ